MRYRNLLCVILLFADLAYPYVVFGMGSRPVGDEPVGTGVESCSDAASFHPERILVKPKKDLPLSSMASLHATSRAEVLHTFKAIGNLQIVRLPKGASVLDFVALYQKSGIVEYAEPDYLVYSCETHPNDPHYVDGSQWALHNTGQNGGKLDADIDAPEGWDVLHDAPDVIVAVIDSGVRYTHEDLADNMWVNSGEDANGNGRFDNWPSTEERDGLYGDLDGIDNDGNGFVDDVIGMDFASYPGSSYPQRQDNDPWDVYGHGTHVAGIIGAAGNNALGVAGVAWCVKIMALQFIGGPDANGKFAGWTSDAIRCIDYAHANGVHIMSNSWGGSESGYGVKDAIARARDSGIIFVAGAGNSAIDTDYVPFYPAVYDLDNIVSVTATDRNDVLASFSNYGLQSVDLGAPGVEILSTYNDSDSAYSYKSGTSMATPYVSGVLALVKVLNPTESYSQLIKRVFMATNPLPALEGKCMTGGRLNLRNVLANDLPDLCLLPVGGLHFGGVSGGPFGPSNWTYSISNCGSVAFGWTVVSTENWLDVWPTDGTIEPGESVTVAVSVNSNANEFGAGTYQATLLFTNVTSGSGSTTRGVSLVLGAVHVRTDGSDASDGSDWILAKRTVQAAISSAYPGQEIWVAAGTYVENIALKPEVSLYGGFVGVEATRSERPSFPRPAPDPNESVLDGSQAARVVTVLSGATAATRINGFTIRNGKGGIYCAAYTSPTIAYNRILDNTHTGSGSGIYSAQNSSPDISYNTISGNLSTVCSTCYAGGAGIYISSAATIRNNIINNNTFSGSPNVSGGGVAGGSSTITENVIENNSSSGYGGGISNGALVSNNIVTDNSATYGGGISGGGMVLHNVIRGNTATYGGGVSRGRYRGTVANNVIAGNSAWQGGGLYCECSFDSISNNTLLANTATHGGGISIGYWWPEEVPCVANNIIAFCSSGILSNDNSPPHWNNCLYGNSDYDYQGLSPGTGDVFQDPLFADVAEGDYHLTAASPSINAGCNSALGLPSTDLDGQPRIQDGIVDIGAYEYPFTDGPQTAINTAKSAANGRGAVLDQAVVTAAFPDFFYIESDDRAVGIRVEKTSHGLVAGVRADVLGIVRTNADDERYIAATSAPQKGVGAVSPLAMSNRSLGGGDWHYVQASGAGQRGVAGGSGLNNIGLLVKTWGKVVEVAPDETWIRIDDGSTDSTGEKVRPKVKLRSGAPPPSLDTYVLATGIVSCEKDGEILNPVLLARYGTDVREPSAPGVWRLYVADWNSSAVRRYDGLTGTFIDDFVPVGSGGLDHPQGLTFGPNGHLYVSSYWGNSVLLYSGDNGTYLGQFVPPGEGGLSNPLGLTFGADGDLYVSSSNSGQILKFHGASGEFLGVFASGAGVPHGLVFGPDGHLYVADQNNSRVLKYDGATGEFFGVFASGGGLSYPVGLAFGADGNLYVAGYYSNSIVCYDGTTGAFLRVVASGGGLATPADLDFGPDGNLYVANSGPGNTVRRYDPYTGEFLGDFVTSGSGGLLSPTYLLFRQE